jgi:hypothetical protein
VRFRLLVAKPGMYHEPGRKSQPFRAFPQPEGTFTCFQPLGEETEQRVPAPGMETVAYGSEQNLDAAAFKKLVDRNPNLTA